MIDQSNALLIHVSMTDQVVPFPCFLAFLHASPIVLPQYEQICNCTALGVHKRPWLVIIKFSPHSVTPNLCLSSTHANLCHPMQITASWHLFVSWHWPCVLQIIHLAFGLNNPLGHWHTGANAGPRSLTFEALTNISLDLQWHTLYEQWVSSLSNLHSPQHLRCELFFVWSILGQ